MLLLMRKFGVLLLLLSLLGQSLQAVALACVHKTDNNGVQYAAEEQSLLPCHMKTENQGRHTPSSTEVSEPLLLSMDCCDSDCQCPANACNSLSALAAHSIQVIEPVASIHALPAVEIINDPYLKSRYRPPIHI